MADELIPADVREFIIDHIDSIAQLEALLLLLVHKHERFTAVSVAAQLYIGENEARAILAGLCNAGLAGCTDDIYWFNSEAPGLRGLVERVAALYSSHLIPVTNLVHTKPAGVRAFAAAFRLRKDR